MKELSDQQNHTLENQLIIDVSKTQNEPQQIERISNLLQKTLDWHYIIKITEQNCVLPLFSWNLLQNFKELLPKYVLEELNQYLQNHTQRNLSLTRKLVDVIRLFESKNIPVISFKGPLLSIQAYGNLAMRQFNDLDILVHPNHLDESINLLVSKGFIPKSSLRWFERKNWYLSRKKDVIFVDEKSEYILELHWKLSGAHFSYTIENDRLWENMETAQLAGIDVRVLHFNDLFIYLCLHGARHSWERLSWICDLNELINSNQQIDWREIESIAKRAGCENILGLGLFLIHRFFGTRVPVQNWEEIQNDQIFMELAEQIEKRIFAEDAVNQDISERYTYHLKLKEKPWDKMKLHLHYNFWYLQLLLFPNRVDKETFNLPAWSNPIYFVIRPMRLIYTYFIKSKK